jgi:outer membrane cobalamin receptor
MTFVGAMLAFEIGPGFEVHLSADNLLDERYQSVFGYGAPGRSLSLGFRLAI